MFCVWSFQSQVYERTKVFCVWSFQSQVYERAKVFCVWSFQSQVHERAKVFCVLLITHVSAVFYYLFSDYMQILSIVKHFEVTM